MFRTRHPLADRVVLITGGARGIGRATAEAFLQAGAPVALCDIDEVAVHATAQALASRGPQVRPYALDVTDPAAFASVVERIEASQGPIAVLVNNAGIMPLGGFLDQAPEADHRQLQINLYGVLHGMRAVLPKMLSRRDGHIVNIASVAGKLGVPHAAVYSGTKHAVIGLTEAVRHEYRDQGVRFSYVMPALVETELIRGAGRPRFPPPAQPEDVARAVVHRAVRRGRVAVFVPRFAALSAVLPAVLPRPLYERIGEAFGLADMFRHVDEEARSSYTRRVFGGKARAATDP